MAYVMEKRVARDPSRFGKGAIEGLSAPESANNAAVQTAFIPTLTMGIPGTATMAIMRGDYLLFLLRPISATLLALAFALTVYIVWSQIQSARRRPPIVVAD